MQFIAMNGKWLSLNIEQVAARMIPRFVDPALITPLLSYLPSADEVDEFASSGNEMDQNIPREVSAPVVRALKDFWKATQANYRKHATKLDNAHGILSHQKDLQFAPLERITRTLLEKHKESLTPADMYAVRRALLADMSGFGFDARSHGRTQIFQIRSREQKEMLSQVRQWIRDYQEQETTRNATATCTSQYLGWKIVNDFVLKAQSFIQQNRKLRPLNPYGIISPSSIKISITSKEGTMQREPLGHFDGNEKLIIKFLEAWSIQKLFSRDVGFAALPPVILRATGMYDDLKSMGYEAGYIFLQEIGVFDSYANINLYDVNLLLPSSQYSRKIERLASKLDFLRPEEVKLPDRMAHLRHHWRDLNVFCIDDKGSFEIDDGVSIEKIPDSPTEHWVHVHIANPTAFLEDDGAFARMASHLTETFYSPEENFYLLPPWMAVDMFSLGPDRPCLTVSARINEHGELLETKIQPAVIHKVRKLTYGEANQLLGFEDDRSSETLTIGLEGEEKSRPETPLPALEEDELEDLRLLQKVAFSRVKFRLSEGSLYSNRWDPVVRVYDRPGCNGLPHAYPHRATALKTLGDPVMEMTVRPLNNWFSDLGKDLSISDAIVRESMLLACEAAGKWSRDRNIPVLYRGATNDFLREEREQFERDVLRPAMEANGGSPPMWAGIQYVKFGSMGLVAAKPLKHDVLGLDQYTKVTSPLRRYGDMLTHWQIEACLRVEAEEGRSMVGQTDHLSRLPFSEKRIATVLARLQPREQLIRRAKLSSERFWLAMFLMRSHFFGELPAEKQKWKSKVLIIYISKHSQTRRVIIAIHMDWSLQVRVSQATNEQGVVIGPDPELGDIWEFEMTEVNVYHGHISGQIKNLISRKQF